MRVLRMMGWMVKALLLWFLLAWLLPFPDHKLQEFPNNTRYLDAEGGLLRRTLGEGGVDADWLPLSQSGGWAGPALIAVEDQRFARHVGVDPLAVIRALGQNLREGEVVSGASTISTQVIRLIEPRPRTLRTKLIEAFRATQLELRYDKDFILEQYLNRAPFGGNRQGLATASRRYYGREAGLLSAGEAALLMGLPKNPAGYRPDLNPELAEARRETVLRRMQEEGLISERPLLTQGRRWVAPGLRAFHFTEWIRRRHGHQQGDLQTTLDPGLQQRCEEILAGVRAEALYAETDGVGVLLMDARSGAVRAWVGSWDTDHAEHGQVDTVTRRRAPGSTLKPFAFALAMQQGWLTPASLLEDRPRAFRDYRPENMGGDWSGEVTARDALVRSLNMPALSVLERTGVDPWLALLRSCGMELRYQTAEEVGLGGVLGGGMELSLLELVQAYRVFACGGEALRAWGLTEPSVPGEQVLDYGVAYWISEMLCGGERDEMLYGHRGETARPDLAFKTGTSHGHRDAWAVGWNGDWVLGVWVGRMDGGRVPGLSGGSHAAPLLGRLATDIFGAGSGAWPEAPPHLQQWQGREVLMGVSDLEPVTFPEIRPVIVSPAPGLELWVTSGEGLHVPLKASAPPGMEVDWFVNGRWLGMTQADTEQVIFLTHGTHVLRAVFGNGESCERRLRVL